MSLKWIRTMSNTSEAEEALDNADAIKERAEEILNPDWDIDYVYWDYNDKLDRKEIIAVGSDDNRNYHNEAFPIDWLFLDDKSLLKAKSEEAERKRIEIERQKAKQKAKDEMLKEKKERAAYERLKAKFEP